MNRKVPGVNAGETAVHSSGRGNSGTARCVGCYWAGKMMGPLTEESPSSYGVQTIWMPPTSWGLMTSDMTRDLTLSAKHRRELHSHTVHKKKCTMESCFDYSLCRLVGLRMEIYIYHNSNVFLTPLV